MRSRRIGQLVIVVAALGMLSAAVSAQSRSGAAEDDRARQLGALQLTRLDVRFTSVPVEAALDSLSTAIGVPIRGRFIDRRHGEGIDPSASISLDVTDAEALSVLEMVLDQAALHDPVTWQLRRGFIEVGTKQRLSAPAAQDTRTYDPGDLLIEPPDFASRGGGARPGAGGFATGSVIGSHPYAGAWLGSRGSFRITSPDANDDRRSDEALMDDLIRAIVDSVEPGNWDYGQVGRSAYGSVNPSGGGAKIARIRSFKRALVIRAPDFVHRQVAGYPRPIEPTPLTVQQRAQRSADASGSGAKVMVYPRDSESGS